MKAISLLLWAATFGCGFAHASAAESATPQLAYSLSSLQLGTTISQMAPLSIALALALPLGLALACWAESRAWIYALCGNYEAAAQIYEKKMRRGRVTASAYLRLASLYLLQGRHDARALLAYRIVREINVAMRAHSHIPEVVEFELVT